MLFPRGVRSGLPARIEVTIYGRIASPSLLSCCVGKKSPMSMSSSSLSRRLLLSSSSGDVAATARCLSSFIDGSVRYASVTERKGAVRAIMETLRSFPLHSGITAACVGALTHATFFCVEVCIDVAFVLKAVRRHESDPLVAKAASRLLSFHIGSSERMEDLPSVANAAARWIQAHPADEDVAYHSSAILIQAVGMEPDEVKTELGDFGVEETSVAVVKGAVAVQVPFAELQVGGKAWNEHVLTEMYPRLRPR